MGKSPLIIGLTGGIGSGKSEVARRFEKLGICVVDADEIAREVVLPGQAALAEIVTHFGSELLTPEGALDRAQLRKIIFSNPDAKQWLENLLHPPINRLIRARLAEAQSPYVILASPLLLETEQHRLANRILVVDTSEEQQLLRASKRDTTSVDQIKAIMASQISRAERVARAQDVVQNMGSLAELDTQVLQLHQTYSTLAKAQQESLKQII